MRTCTERRPGSGQAVGALHRAPLAGGRGPPAPSANPGLIPPDGAAPGWTRAGTQRVYGPGELYNYIDGGAELFLEFGFEA